MHALNRNISLQSHCLCLCLSVHTPIISPYKILRGFSSYPKILNIIFQSLKISISSKSKGGSSSTQQRKGKNKPATVLLLFHLNALGTTVSVHQLSWRPLRLKHWLVCNNRSNGFVFLFLFKNEASGMNGHAAIKLWVGDIIQLLTQILKLRPGNRKAERSAS